MNKYVSNGDYTQHSINLINEMQKRFCLQRSFSVQLMLLLFHNKQLEEFEERIDEFESYRDIYHEFFEKGRYVKNV